MTDLGSLIERLLPILGDRGLFNVSRFERQLREELMPMIIGGSFNTGSQLPMDIVKRLSGEKVMLQYHIVFSCLINVCIQ